MRIVGPLIVMRTKDVARGVEHRRRKTRRRILAFARRDRVTVGLGLRDEPAQFVWAGDREVGHRFERRGKDLLGEVGVPRQQHP